MASAHLRVYHGPDCEVDAKTLENQVTLPQVTLPLGEILPMIADAFQSRRTWLGDFSDDPITISSDLYEVILAYQHLRRPSA